MAKYSTGDSGGGGGGGSCELCGKASDSLTRANVAGAELDVCDSCADHNDNAHTEQKRRERERSDEQERRRRAARNTARAVDAASNDSTHWEEHGTNYDDDPLPYLVSDYGDRLQQARQEAGLQRAELAEELEIDENHLLAVEQSRANQANIGGSIIERIESHLDITLSE